MTDRTSTSKREKGAFKQDLDQREVEYQRAIKVQTALYKIADAASAATDMQAFYVTLHQIISELMYAENMFIALYDEQSDMITRPYFVDTVEVKPLPIRLEDHHGATGWVLRHGRSLADADGSYHAAMLRGEAEEVGVSSNGIAIPLKSDDKTVGVLLVQSYKEEIKYTLQDLEILNFVAQHISTALSRARSLEEIRQRNAELAILNSVGEAMAKTLDIKTMTRIVGDKLREIFNVEALDIMLLDPQTNLIHVPYSYYRGVQRYLEDNLIFPLGKGLTSQVISSRQPLVFGTLQSAIDHGSFYLEEMGEIVKVESNLIVPILAGEKALGVVSLGSYKQYAFDMNHVRLLQTLSSNIGVALENARLFEAEQQRIAELAIINSVQEGLAKQIDFQGIVDLVGKKVGEIFEADSVNVCMVDPARDWMLEIYYADRGQRVLIPQGPMIRPSLAAAIVDSGKYLLLGSTDEQKAVGYNPIPRHAGEEDLNQSYLGVPIHVNEQVSGLIAVLSYAERAFDENDLRLLQTIASSMSVALENARLFDEVQKRNHEITEALEQQTATSDILRVIAGSPTDIQPIMQVIAEHAVKLTNALYGTVYLTDGQMIDEVAEINFSPEAKEATRSSYPRPLHRDSSVSSRAIVDRTILNIPDVLNDPSLPELTHFYAKAVGFKSLLIVPMIRDQKAIGSVGVGRAELGPFTEKQINLLKIFADQAIIAIENVRLFNELQSRNREITEALEQQTATSEILRVIAESPTDVRPVLDVIAKHAARLSDSVICSVYQYDGKMLSLSANEGFTPEAIEEAQRDYPRPLDREGGISALVIMTRKVIHIPDAWNDSRVPELSFRFLKALKADGVLFVPLLREGVAVGAIGVVKRGTTGYTDKQIELVKTFADQAAIAIENVRLFNETTRLLKETEQRAAELEIIKSVQEGLASKLDMQAIYDLVGDKIREIFDAHNVTVNTFDLENRQKIYHYIFEKGQYFPSVARPMNSFDEFFIRSGEYYLINEDVVGSIARQFPDVTPIQGELPKSFLCAPLMREKQVIGYISIQNLDRENAFSSSDVRLLQTLTNSMSVALENARLFDETQRRASELSTINTVSNALAGELDLSALIELVGEQIRFTFKADIAYVALLDPETNLISYPYEFGQHLEPSKLGQGLSSKIIETGKPLLINKDIMERHAELGAIPAGKDARSYLGVPIFVSSKAIGVVSVQSTERENIFSEADQRLLSTIAANVGGALQNARLFDEIKRRKEYFEALFQNNPVAVVTIDNQSTVVSWNPAAEKLFGYSQEEAFGQNLDDLVAKREDLHVEAIGYTNSGLKGVRTITQRNRRDGTLVDVEMLGVPVTVAGKRTGGIAIYHDITELERARREAIAANKEKSTFLANMSHELRTPLNAIIGFTRIVRRKGEGLLPEKQTENLDKVLTSSEHLLNLINTVLDISKIEAGRMDVQAANFRINDLIDLCADTAQPLLRPNVVLEKKVDERLTTIYSDQDKIKQIVLNLLSNAAKFTHEGIILITTERVKNDILQISVSDTGIGINEEALSRIFKEFQQADSSTTRQYGGTGLGLAISRNLARLIGGDLTADSELGRGSMFTLVIPIWVGSKSVLNTIASTPSEKDNLPGIDAAKKRILVIDDDPDAVYLLQENLNPREFDIIGTRNGQEGLHVARKQKPQAILLDIIMPGVDGWQILHDLKEDPATAGIPVILLTIVDKKALGFQMGASAYLLKPLDPVAVRDAINRVTFTSVRSLTHILVVDDDPSIADLLRQSLPESEFKVDSALDGAAGLRSVKANRPDIILLDIIMPRLDGFGVIERLRSDPQTQDLPIIVLSAKELTRAESTKLNKTVVLVMKKQGFQGEKLVDEINKVLR